MKQFQRALLFIAVAALSTAAAQAAAPSQSSAPTPSPTVTPTPHPLAHCDFSSEEKGLPGVCTADLTECPVILGPIGSPNTCLPELKVVCDGDTLFDGPWAAFSNGTNPAVAQGIASPAVPVPPSIFFYLPPDSSHHVAATLNLAEGQLSGSCLVLEGGTLR